MSTLSTFQINQPPGTPYGTWDRSRRDIELYSVASEKVECEALEKSESSYLWEISCPYGVSVTLNNPTTHTCDFQLVVRGTYLVTLTVNAGDPDQSITTLTVMVVLEGSQVPLPGLNETNQDNSLSPFTGERGTEEKQNTLSEWLNRHVARPVEYVNSTPKTLTAALSGRGFIVSGAGVIFDLPAAAEGLSYYIAASATQTTVLNPDGSENIYGPFGAWAHLRVTVSSAVFIRSISDGAGGWKWNVETGEGKILDNDTPTADWFFSGAAPGLFEEDSGTASTRRIGVSAEAPGDYSMATGRLSKSKWYGSRAHASAGVGGAGYTQSVDVPLTAETPAATWVDLNPGNGVNYLAVDEDSTILCDVLITTRRDTGARTKGWRLEFMIENDGGTTQLIPGSTNKTVLGATSSGNEANWDVQVLADDTNDRIQIQVKGDTGDDLVWQGSIRAVEVRRA